MCNVMWPCNTMIWTGCSDKSLINISLISTDSVWYKLAKKRSRRTPPIISLLHSSRVAFHSACRSSVSYILADLRHQVTLFCSIHAVALVCIWKISVIFLDQPNGQLFLKLGRKKNKHFVHHYWPFNPQNTMPSMCTVQALLLLLLGREKNTHNRACFSSFLSSGYITFFSFYITHHFRSHVCYKYEVKIEAELYKDGRHMRAPFNSVCLCVFFLFLVLQLLVPDCNMSSAGTGISG